LSNAADYSISLETAGNSGSALKSLGTAASCVLSTYFFIACSSLYWLTAGAGALVSAVVPRWLIERCPLAWLAASSVLMVAMTQTIPNFFPDYTNPREILFEILLWLSIGLFARVYLVYTDHPDTFEGLKRSIASRPLERWLSTILNHPIDAIFTRIWVGNSLAILPLTILLIAPPTVNYFVIAAYGVALLLIQFPHELIDHTNIHTRVFAPKIGASPRAKLLLKGLQFYFDYVLALLALRPPYYYRVQHVYIHHVEDNGPDDSQSTMTYDRASYLDFCRHAFKQGLDLVSGYTVFRYLQARGKKRQIRELLRGLAIWYVMLAAVAVFNPIAAALLFVSRFLGGNLQSLVAFWQHGLVDPNEAHEPHGHSVDYAGPEHGNLGNDYHVEHHHRPGRHWSAYYEVFSRQVESAGGHPAVVMQKEVFGPLAFVAALWRRDFASVAASAKLARGGESRGELARLVHERTRPIGGAVRTGMAARIDAVLGRAMALVLPTAFRV
jgi:hypothetical protein